MVHFIQPQFTYYSDECQLSFYNETEGEFTTSYVYSHATSEVMITEITKNINLSFNNYIKNIKDIQRWIKDIESRYAPKILGTLEQFDHRIIYDNEQIKMKSTIGGLLLRQHYYFDGDDEVVIRKRDGITFEWINFKKFVEYFAEYIDEIRKYKVY